MDRNDVRKILTMFLDPYLKFGTQTLFFVIDDSRCRIKTPVEMTGEEIIIRKFSRKILTAGLTAKEWESLLDEVIILQERFPKCLG